MAAPLFQLPGVTGSGERRNTVVPTLPSEEEAEEDATPTTNPTQSPKRLHNKPTQNHAHISLSQVNSKLWTQHQLMSQQKLGIEQVGRLLDPTGTLSDVSEEVVEQVGCPFSQQGSEFNPPLDAGSLPFPPPGLPLPPPDLPLPPPGLPLLPGSALVNMEQFAAQVEKGARQAEKTAREAQQLANWASSIVKILRLGGAANRETSADTDTTFAGTDDGTSVDPTSSAVVDSTTDMKQDTPFQADKEERPVGHHDGQGEAGPTSQSSKCIIM